MHPVLSAILILVFMIFLNGFFSLAEMAVVSSRKPKLRVHAEKGGGAASAVLSLTEKPTAFLSTIQIGITLIGILAGAYGEAKLAGQLSVFLSKFPVTAAWSETAATGTVVISVTFVSILAGELIPKKIALAAPERIAVFIVYPMQCLTILFLPIVKILTLLTEGFVWIIGIRRTVEPPVSREEIRMIMREGQQHGLYHKDQSDIAEAALDLHRYRLPLIMTPRPDILYLEITDPAKINREKLIKYCDLSHLPVCRNGLDTIVGVVKTREVMKSILKRKFHSLERHLHKPLFVTEGMSPARLMEVFRSTGNRIAFIVDEYGGLMGLVSLSDILDEIVGEMTVNDPREKSIIERQDGSFLMDGSLPVHDFAEFLHLDMEVTNRYNTLAGLLIDELGHIPVTGERVNWRDLVLEVMDMDGNRVDKVLLYPLEK